jgi:hypothetical protein
MTIRIDPEEFRQLEERARRFALENIQRDSKSVADTLTADDDPILGPLLRLHLLAEQSFGRIFATSFRAPKHLDEARLTFSEKLALVHALGVVPDAAFESMKRINKLRNDVAHKNSKRITITDIDHIGQALGPDFKSLKRMHGKDLKVLAIFTLSKAYEPFLTAALIGEAIAKLKAEQGWVL